MYKLAKAGLKIAPTSASRIRMLSTVNNKAPNVAPSGDKIEELDVKDMSIHGLCTASIKQAFKNFINDFTVSKAASKADAPLGRWKVGTDNFNKSYSYDHTA